MQHTIRVGIVGVTGYTGMELVRLLIRHPVFELNMLTSRQEAGKQLQDLFPQLQGSQAGGLPIVPPEAESISQACDLVFLAVPHGAAMDMASSLYRRNIKIVDLSADFRIRSQQTYEAWYKLKHSCPEILKEAVYGLIELNASAVQKTVLTANPGCYPSSVILGLHPALAQKLVEPASLIIDSKSGATGAGRGTKLEFQFCEVQDNFRAYALSGFHRHTPEIEQELSRIAGREITVSFNPHLLPINRGILSTMYADLKPGITQKQVREAYEEACRPHAWLRLLPEGVLPQLKNVRGTMFCDIGLHVDQRSNKLITVTAIDNLCRGASGQALANANLMSGLEVDTGLDLQALVP